MSVLNAVLNSSLDLNTYNRSETAGATLGTGAFITLLNITGKGGLIRFLFGNSAANWVSNAEYRIKIDGAIYTWNSASFGSSNWYCGGLVDLDDIVYPWITRHPYAIQQSSLYSEVITSPTQALTVGNLLIRRPIQFNSSLLLEVKVESGSGFSWEAFAYYK